MLVPLSVMMESREWRQPSPILLLLSDLFYHRRVVLLQQIKDTKDADDDTVRHSSGMEILNVPTLQSARVTFLRIRESVAGISYH